MFKGEERESGLILYFRDIPISYLIIIIITNYSSTDAQYSHRLDSQTSPETRLTTLDEDNEDEDE
jgi:hypothetical protein